MRARPLRLLGLVATSLAVLAVPAGACGGLVGENGTIELVRTTTLAAYHDGVERYVTSFEFTGVGEEVGSIVPLPGVPTDVERGGDWTLQRLQQEVAPPTRFAAGTAETLAAPKDAEVLLETQIDALDITILRGGGDAVGEWAIDHGFLLTPDAPEVLDFYARRSPVFMAARFDASRAEDLGQQSGDGTPIMLTIPTDEPWVPLRILGLGLDGSQLVQADVFLLTPDRPQLLAGGARPGRPSPEETPLAASTNGAGGDDLTLQRSEPASESLLADLRSDKGMEWVPSDLWLSYLSLDASAGELDYDLAISTHDGQKPSALAAGVSPAVLEKLTEGAGTWPVAVGFAVLVGGAGAFVLTGRIVRRRTSGQAAP